MRVKICNLSLFLNRKKNINADNPIKETLKPFCLLDDVVTKFWTRIGMVPPST